MSRGSPGTSSTLEDMRHTTPATREILALPRLLFSQQAVENSGFLSTDQLLRFGEQVGASDSRFTGCVKNDTYVPWVHQVTDEASQRGVNATPTILVNGRVEPSATTVQGLLAAVAAASR